MNVLTFVLVVSMVVVGVVLAIDSGVDILSRHRETKESLKHVPRMSTARPVRVLSVVDSNKNAFLIYHRPHGSHRRKKVS